MPMTWVGLAVFWVVAGYAGYRALGWIERRWPVRERD